MVSRRTTKGGRGHEITALSVEAAVCEIKTKAFEEKTREGQHERYIAAKTL